MLRAIRHYLWDNGGLFLLCVFSLGGYSLGKYIIPGSEAIVISLPLLMFYFTFFTSKDEAGINPMDRNLPISPGRIWMSKMLSFYFMLFSAGTFYIWVLVKQGFELQKAIDESSLYALILYLIVSAISKLYFFKSKNSRYRVSSLLVLIAYVLFASLYINFVDQLDENLSVIHIVGILIISVIDYMISKLKK